MGGRSGSRSVRQGYRRDSPWYPFEEANDFARLWEAQGPGYRAAYDPRTDELAFAQPGEAEPRRFRPLTLFICGQATKVWPLGLLAGR